MYPKTYLSRTLSHEAIEESILPKGENKLLSKNSYNTGDRKNSIKTHTHSSGNLWDGKLFQTVKSPPARQETWFGSLGQEDLLEKEMATNSSILA